MRSLTVLLVAVALCATACATSTTGKKLADVAKPAPASYAEALKVCVGDDTSNQAMIDACSDAVKADAARAEGTANAAADAAKSSHIFVPTGYYGGYYPSYYGGYGMTSGTVGTGRSVGTGQRVRTY